MESSQIFICYHNQIILFAHFHLKSAELRTKFNNKGKNTIPEISIVDQLSEFYFYIHFPSFYKTIDIIYTCSVIHLDMLMDPGDINH